MRIRACCRKLIPATLLESLQPGSSTPGSPTPSVPPADSPADGNTPRGTSLWGRDDEKKKRKGASPLGSGRIAANHGSQLGERHKTSDIPSPTRSSSLCHGLHTDRRAQRRDVGPPKPRG
ncbi:hypothetical protein VUR80DRAFT_5568 [Thermomyces stellatus]